MSIGVALAAGTVDALSKRGLERLGPRRMALVRTGWGGLFLLPFIVFADPPAAGGPFWGIVATALPIEITAILLYQTALKSSPLSITVPFLAFTPVFLLGAGWLILGEIPEPLGIAGVVLVATGAFILRSSGLSAGGWRRIFHGEKGPPLMLAVAFLYAMTSSLGKRAVQASSPLWFASLYFPLIAVALLPFQGRPDRGLREFLSRPGLFASIGVLEMTVALLQFHAVALAEVAYVVTIKRMSLLVAVIYGRYMFKEGRLVRRLAGALTMVAGAALIALAGL